MSEIEWANVSDAVVKEKFGGTIKVRTIWQAPSGALAQLVEIDAGACWEGLDVHEPGPEEVYVVSGMFNDGVRDYPAGTFIHNPAGSSHVPQSKTGCTLFVFYPEG
ncbi:MAG: cupin domain-containing protein [bacterium]